MQICVLFAEFEYVAEIVLAVVLLRTKVFPAAHRWNKVYSTRILVLSDTRLNPGIRLRKILHTRI